MDRRVRHFADKSEAIHPTARRRRQSAGAADPDAFRQGAGGRATLKKPSKHPGQPTQPSLVPTIKTLPAADLHAAIERLISAIGKRHAGTRSPLLLLGIANGGIELARRLSAGLAQAAHPIASKTGTIDISFHRDDIGNNPIPKEYAHTAIPVDVTGATVILIDDVLFSGRTVKAALDELFDHGRPAKVELAVLVDREGRRLPFAADYSGLILPAADGEKIVVYLDHVRPSGDRVQITPAKA